MANEIPKIIPRLHLVREKVDAGLMVCLVGLLSPTFDESHPAWEWLDPDETETLGAAIADLRNIDPPPPLTERTSQKRTREELQMSPLSLRTGSMPRKRARHGPNMPELPLVTRAMSNKCARQAQKRARPSRQIPKSVPQRVKQGQLEVVVPSVSGCK